MESVTAVSGVGNQRRCYRVISF